MNPAFAYIYDEFLADRRFERDLSFLETEAARRGVEGRVVRLAMFRQPRDIIRDLVSAGVKNVIFVGNDLTLQRMVWFLPDFDITVGFVPMVAGSVLGSLLGVAQGGQGIESIAGRLIEHVDLGKMNDRWFLTEAVLPKTNATIDVDGKYRLRPMHGGGIAIRNLAPAPEGCTLPNDGLLEIVMQSAARSRSAVQFWKKPEVQETKLFLSHCGIEPESAVDVFVDGQSRRAKAFKVEVVSKKLRLIAGRQKAWRTRESLSK